MAAGQWWVIASTQYGQKPSYNYFQGTKAQAEQIASRTTEVSSQPSVTGPFPTKAAAEASVKAGKANTPTIPGGYQQQPGIGNPLSGVAAIGDLASRLTERTTWIRVAKVLIGGALLLIGIAHLTGASDAISTAARRVPLPV